jgi:hypothetical protein
MGFTPNFVNICKIVQKSKWSKTQMFMEEVKTYEV